MAHFYLHEGADAAAVGDEIVIAGPEARHAVVVSRLRPGESIMVGNGAGLIMTATVVAAASDQLRVSVTARSTTSRKSPRIWLAQALAKGGRDELAVQMATELGVDVVVPWSAERSIVRWDGPKMRKGRERWRSIVREASKQSIRAWLPEVAEVVTTSQLALLAEERQLLVLEPSSSDKLSDFRSDGRDTVVIVGPEGGIARGELDVLQSAGAELARLGETVLRTSSAGPAAIAVINARLGRW